MPTSYQSVKQFHEAFGHPVDTVDLTNDTEELREFLKLRKRLVMEEAKEFCDALDELDPQNAMKEACDIDYVVQGTLVAIKGLTDPTTDGAFAEVHRSNMSKLGEDGKPIYREDGKVLKGPNYTEPDMSNYVRLPAEKTFRAKVYVPDGVTYHQFFNLLPEVQNVYLDSRHFQEQVYANLWVLTLDTSDIYATEADTADKICAAFDCRCSHHDVTQMQLGWRPAINPKNQFTR